jgi:carbamoyltransferase
MSHDGGTALGLAWMGWQNYSQNTKPHKLKSLYLGLEPDYSELDNFINSLNLDSKETSYEEVAELLANENIVALFQGRAEAGPRALGNRSILFDPRVVDGKDKVNKVKGREWFRPFAGSVMKEHTNEWFDMAGLEESPFMMYAVDVQTDKLDKILSVTHVDGTCRVQTVSEENNLHYYNLIKAFNDKTGTPILFNTSYNLAGEPLVENIEDALQTIARSEIGYLYLPELNKLIFKKEK